MTVEAAEIVNCDACNGGLVFDATGALPEIDLFNGYAWCALDTSDLWKVAVRGDNRLVPGLAGRRRYPREIDQVTMEFPLVVVGKYDELGNLWADPDEGLDENLYYLRENLELPLATGDGSRPMTWTRESGIVLTTDVHVEPPFEYEIGPGAVARAVVEVTVSNGLFTVSGS